MAAAGQDLSVRVVDKSEGFRNLRDAWNDLLMRSHSATPFQTWEWLWSWYTQIAPKRRLLILMVYHGETLIGIAPFERVGFHGLPVRRLRFMGGGPSDYLDGIYESGREEDVVSAVFGWVKENRSQWDILDLQHVRQDSPTLRHLELLGAESDWRVATRPQDVCPCALLGSDWQTTAARFGKKTRSNLAYYERLASREFNVEMREVRTEELESALGRLFELHAARWRKRLLPGVLGAGRTQRFHRTAAPLLAESGRLKFLGIRLNGEWQSLLYCLALGERTMYYIGGWNPEFRKYSLGTLLIGKAMKDAVDGGCVEFDFLRGDERYKELWTTEKRVSRRIIAHLGTPGGLLGSRAALTGNRAGYAAHGVWEKVQG